VPDVQRESEVKKKKPYQGAPNIAAWKVEVRKISDQQQHLGVQDRIETEKIAGGGAPRVGRKIKESANHTATPKFTKRCELEGENRRGTSASEQGRTRLKLC